jgi:tRNA uracil 4-sulfurtransferase
MHAPDHVVIHYAEIALKSGNRGYFERLLVRNVRRKLGAVCRDCRREDGQLTVVLTPGADLAQACDVLRRIPGIAHFAPARRLPCTQEDFRAATLDALAGRDFQTFKIDTHRPHRHNAFRSMEVNRTLGGVVLDAYPDKKVRMTAPDLVVKLEIGEHGAYLSVDRHEGVGGLPTNTRQRVVVLLSGGFDSPVAAYLMMKRGCEVILMHVQHEHPQNASVENKIVRLAEQLARYQLTTRLHLVPFEALQREIIKHAPIGMRMLVYRRLMLELGARLARQSRARFLVTGDSLSQVASQTYDNLAALYRGSAMPVLTPLIGLDKREIVALARQIDTYAISALPHEDCCSRFVPRHPELRARAAHLDAALELSPWSPCSPPPSPKPASSNGPPARSAANNLCREPCRDKGLKRYGQSIL